MVDSLQTVHHLRLTIHHSLMQILSLALEDTKSYKQASITFTEGVNAIVGHNGAGKSTILEAIGFALFDMIGYTASDFVREDAKLATITVGLVSSVDDRVYHVIRRCGRRTDYQIFDPDLQQKICEGKADVLTFLRQHMGVDPGADLSGLFRDAVGVPQGTFTAAFLQTASQRKNIFDPLLQVEEYRTAAEKLNEPRRLLKDRQTQIDIQISAVEARLERLPLLESESATRSQELLRNQQEAGEVERQLAEATTQLTALEKIRQQVTEAEKRYTQSQQRLATLETQIATAQKALTQAEQARQIVASNQSGHDQYLAAQAEQRTLEEQTRQRQQLLNQRATADKSLALAENAIQNLQSQLDEVARAETTVAALQADVETQTALEQQLASYQQQRARLVDIQQAQQRQTQELKRLQQRHEQMQAQLARASHLHKEQADVEQQNATLHQEIEERRPRLAQYKVEADALKSQSEALGNAATARCPVCEQPLSEIHRSQLLERNQQRISELRTTYSSEQTTIKNGEATLKQLRESLQKASAELLRLPRADEAAELANQIEQTDAESQRLLEQSRLLEQVPAEIGKLEAALTTLNNPRQRSQIAADRAEQRTTIATKLQQAIATRKDVEQQLAALQAKLAAFSELDKAIETVTKSLQSCSNAYQQVLSNRKLAETVEEQKVSLSNLQTLLEAAQGDVATNEAEKRALAATFDPTHFQQLQQHGQQLRAQSASLQTRQTMLQDAQNRAAQEIEQLRHQQEQVIALQQQRQTLADQEQVLETMRGALRQAGPHITRAIITQISNGANQTFGDLMQDFSRNLQWNEDYGITLEVDGRQRQFSQLSGGEQMSAALAVRLALLREMSNIDVAFFDEPTTNLDDARRESLARQIMDIRGFRQLFVISHDDTFEQATQNVIRVKQVDGRSEVQN